jgi:hypothetical protein
LPLNRYDRSTFYGCDGAKLQRPSDTRRAGADAL